MEIYLQFFKKKCNMLEIWIKNKMSFFSQIVMKSTHFALSLEKSFGFFPTAFRSFKDLWKKYCYFVGGKTSGAETKLAKRNEILVIKHHIKILFISWRKNDCSEANERTRRDCQWTRCYCPKFLWLSSWMLWISFWNEIKNCPILSCRKHLLRSLIDTCHLKKKNRKMVLEDVYMQMNLFKKRRKIESILWNSF